MTLMFNIDRETHKAITSKDRTSLFIDRDPFLIDEKIGQEFGHWLDSGIDPKEIEAEKERKVHEEKLQKYENFLIKLDNVKTTEELREIYEEIKSKIKELEKPMLDDLVERVKAIKMDLELAETGSATAKPQEKPEEKPAKIEPKPQDRITTAPEEEMSENLPPPQEKITKLDANPFGTNLFSFYKNQLEKIETFDELSEIRKKLNEYRTIFTEEERNELKNLIEEKSKNF